MACMQCGSDEVDNFRYCSKCIRDRQSTRSSTRQAAVMTFRKDDSTFDQVIANPLVWAVAGSFFYLALIVVFFFVGPARDKGLIGALLSATVAMGVIVSAAATWLIRVKRVVGGSGWEQCKLYYVLLYGAIAMTLLSSLLLSRLLGVSIFEARTLVEESFSRPSTDTGSASYYYENHYYEDE